MRKLTLIVALCLGITAGYAQKVKAEEVPVAVKDAFTKKYPGLKAEWEKEDGNYEAEFDGKQMKVNMESGKSSKAEVEGSVLISPDGSILETEEEIETSTLPKGVSEYVTKNLGGKKIAEAFKITNASGAISYEIEIGKDEYLFDNSGAFVKKIDKKDEKDDNDRKGKKK
jgi:hypothetical protein